MGSGDDCVISKTQQTLNWMQENEIHFCKSNTGKGPCYNLFDYRNSRFIRFIHSVRSFAEMVRYVDAERPFFEGKPITGDGANG